MRMVFMKVSYMKRAFFAAALSSALMVSAAQAAPSSFFDNLSEADFLRQLELHVAAINAGIEGIPRDRIRLHVCWGNNDGPHI